MIARISSCLKRFRKDEEGHMIIEFAIIVPAIFSMFLASVEFGIYSMRQLFLDRGLDLAVREIRLNTGIDLDNDGKVDFDHPVVKQKVCDYAGFLNSGGANNCDTTLRLEMEPIDPFAYVGLSDVVDCVDVSEPINQPRGFTNGVEHQLMIMRACVKFDPVFPTTGLGRSFSKDGAGKVKMISMSAFVQEPI
ncbi:TadE/TadG family type IV pilus assembly protein [Roseobacter sinensis]|uniref:Pilus assembly protein n=1 Tax=Roseobacter sinensis TaxID=2931391 RepID=A0ABT3BG87_9RHOB|nr:TadE/TadG family type IV pilus assembly protein [Roseobacter sp. WL0113]MCV3272602.1 pilus assembly protein [Roseobacter sp. WL0113]